MAPHSNRLSRQGFQSPVATASVGLTARFKKATSAFKEKVVLATKDLDLLTSLYLARFILWRTTRKRL